VVIRALKSHKTIDFFGLRARRGDPTGLGLFTAHSAPERVLELAKREAPQMAKILKAAGIEPE
jgi:hypothetical protein